MSPQSTFSVVIPCYNAARFIESTIQSALNQTHRPHEIIVVDDNSSDNSVEVIQQFGPAVTILNSTCRNGAGTRNVGVRAATGHWIAFLDADDVWYPDHLERALNLLAGSSDIGFLNWFDSFSDQSPDERRSRPNKLSIDKPTSGLSDLTFFRNYERTHWFNMHGCVVERQRLLEVGLLDETQTRRHDIEMWLRVVTGKTWSFDPVPSTAYRVDTPDSISRQVADAAYFAFVALHKNRLVFPEDMAKRLLQRAARSAMVNALVSGSESELSRARKETWSWLRLRDRLVISPALVSPGLFRSAIMAKRRLSGNQD